MRYKITMNWNPRKSKIWKNHQKRKFLGKSCIRTRYLRVVRRTLYHCTNFKPEPRLKKTSLYKYHTQFIEQIIGWSGRGVEQKSGISHIINLSNFDFLGFQILMIWDLWGINFHTVVVLSLIFHVWFKFLSALCVL